MKKEDIIGTFSVILGAIFMGTVGIFIRNIEMNYIQLTFFRFFFGFMFLLIVISARKERLKFKNIRLLVLISIINVLMVTTYILSVQLIPLGMAALLLYLAPVYVIPIAYITGERINPRVLIALPISLFGLFLMLMNQGVINIGIIFGLVAGLCYAFYFFVIKKLRLHLESIEITVSYLGISSLILLPSLAMPVSISNSEIPWLIGLGLIPTAVAFTLFNYGLKYCKVTEGPIFALVEPVSAGFFGYILFGEIFTPIQILGMGLVLLGIGTAIKEMEG